MRPTVATMASSLHAVSPHKFQSAGRRQLLAKMLPSHQQQDRPASLTPTTAPEQFRPQPCSSPRQPQGVARRLQQAPAFPPTQSAPPTAAGSADVVRPWRGGARRTNVLQHHAGETLLHEPDTWVVLAVPGGRQGTPGRAARPAQSDGLARGGVWRGRRSERCAAVALLRCWRFHLARGGCLEGGRPETRKLAFVSSSEQSALFCSHLAPCPFLAYFSFRDDPKAIFYRRINHYPKETMRECKK